MDQVQVGNSRSRLAASKNMATARASGPSDARIPCPQCQNPIHPIAGRCKHCKADLAALRGARPTAAAALPSLAAIGLPRTPMQAVTSAASARPAAVSFDAGADEAAAILPPRQTGRHQAVAPQGSAWKSWPVIVIVLASVAIIVALVLLLWPDAKPDNRLIEPPGPAPDRMNTNPLPDKQPDPWQGGGKSSGIDPGATPDPGTAPDPGKRPPPPDPLPPDDPDDDDIFGGLGGGAGGAGGGLGGLNTTMLGVVGGMVQHTCDRIAACSGNDDAKDACDQVRKNIPKASVPSCAAATRCFARIDAIDCDDISVDDIPSLMTTLSDCSDAMQC